MPEQCELDYKEHIKKLKKQIKELEERKESWTEEDEELYGELRRRVYRSKMRKHCC